ncbi:MAG: serine/threonine protein kinase [Desulfurococcales archaeon]|nr:serine/threonine protein kinase [Desulfurococcales archaeon]
MNKTHYTIIVLLLTLLMFTPITLAMKWQWRGWNIGDTWIYGIYDDTGSLMGSLQEKVIGMETYYGYRCYVIESDYQYSSGGSYTSYTYYTLDGKLVGYTNGTHRLYFDPPIETMFSKPLYDGQYWYTSADVYINGDYSVSVTYYYNVTSSDQYIEVFEYFYDGSTGTYMLWTIYEIDPSINYVEALVFFDENGNLLATYKLRQYIPGEASPTSGTTLSTSPETTVSGGEKPPPGEQPSDTIYAIIGLAFIGFIGIGIAAAILSLRKRRKKKPMEYAPAPQPIQPPTPPPPPPSREVQRPRTPSMPSTIPVTTPPSVSQTAWSEIYIGAEEINVEPGGSIDLQVRIKSSAPCEVWVEPPGPWMTIIPRRLRVSAGENNVLFKLSLSSSAPAGEYNIIVKTSLGASSKTKLYIYSVPTAKQAIQLPGYEIIAPIGSGGFSVVYKGRRIKDGMVVAIKIPRIELGATMAASMIQGFKKEAETWSKLRHLHIVQVLDYGLKPIPYLVTEYMPGGTLRKKLGTNKPLGLRKALEITIGVGEALSYAHHLGVIHRDIKPENVLFDKNDVAKVTDFGLAKVLLEASMASGVGFKGTLLYAAPEQIDSTAYGNVDWRTDIWQYGAMFYEMLTGRPPYKADSPLQLINKIVSSKPVPPSMINRSIPRELDIIVMKCLEKRKEDRWRSIDVILEKLYRIRNRIDMYYGRY